MGLFSKRVSYLNFPNLDPNLPTRCDIVGEASYRETLLRMATEPPPEDSYHWVALRAEPKNPYDSSAIRVDWVLPDGSGWLTCGYIPQADTGPWHAVLATTPAGVVWVWPATLIGDADSAAIGLYFQW